MSEKSLKICPNCGTTPEDFRRTGLFGCAACYIVFREEALAAVRRVQDGDHHFGKVPIEGAEEKYQLVIERDQLRESRAQAVREKRLSDAKMIQRRIEELSRLLHPEEDVT